jgi:hypothetical protein
VVNWATLYYACITCGIGFICLAVFVLADLFGTGVFCCCVSKKHQDDRSSTDNNMSKTLDTIKEQVLLHHLWMSVPAALLFGLVGDAPLLRKYQRLAVWWCSLMAHAVGATALVGGLRAAWTWQGHEGEGDLLGRDWQTLLAHYWVPAIAVACLFGKSTQLLLSYLFDRIASGHSLRSSPSDSSNNDQDHNVAVRLVRKATVEPLVASPVVSLVLNLALFALCSVFIFFMTFCILYVGVRFLEVQGKLWLIGTLVGLLADLVLLEPIHLLGALLLGTLFSTNSDGATIHNNGYGHTKKKNEKMEQGVEMQEAQQQGQPQQQQQSNDQDDDDEKSDTASIASMVVSAQQAQV